MEKRVVTLLGGSFFLLLCGVVLSLWSLFTSDGGAVAAAVPVALVLLGVMGVKIGWVLHDVVERLVRLERGREERSSTPKGAAEPNAAADRGR